MAGRGPHNNAITWLPHLHISWGGTLGTSKAEIWQNSLRWMPATDIPPTPTEIDALLAAAANPISLWFNDGSKGTTSFSYISNAARLDWLKMNWILDTGLQRDSNTHVLDANTPVGAQGTTVPYYQTFAVTFRTALKRGRCHSGRMFPPVVAAPVDESGRCSTAIATVMAQGAADMVSGVNAAMSAIQVGTAVILSPGNTTKGQLPLRQNITSAECDTVPDVQHRRTNRLARAIGSPAAVNAG